MTQYQFSIVITQMHAISLAITEIFTVCAFAGLHPGTVSVWLIAVLPYIDEVVLVYVALS
jgi:hypothetical protein